MKQKMDRSEIEEKAIDAVKHYVYRSTRLKPELYTNDKTPLWDGEIRIYDSEERTNEHWHGRVPVQVKGTTIKPKSSSSYPFAVKTKHLEKYALEGGVAYFVVYVNPATKEAQQIYYRLLTLVDIRFLLLDKGEQKKLTIDFDLIPSNPMDFEMWLVEFLNHQKIQAPYATRKLLTPIEFVGMTGGPIETVYNYPRYDHPYVALSSRPRNYFYGVAPDGSLSPLFAKPGPIDVTKTVEMPVHVNGRYFFDSFQLTATHGGLRVNIRKLVELNFYPDGKYGVAIQLKPEVFSNLLPEQIKELRFIEEIVKHDKVMLGPVKLRVLQAHEPELIEQLRDCREHLEDIQTAVDFFGAQSPLDVTMITQEQWPQLGTLVLASKGEEFDTNERFEGLVRLVIGNLTIYIWQSLTPNKKIRLTSAFKEVSCHRARFRDDLTKEMPIYSILDPEQLVEASNLRFDEVNAEYMAIVDRHPRFYEASNWDVLRLLDAYDCTQRREFLKVAYEMSEWLYSDSSPLAWGEKLLNRLQVIKRMRPLTEAEEEAICEIESKTDQDGIIFYCQLLRDEFKAASRTLKRLPKKQQDYLLSYPIAVFYKNRANNRNQ